MTGGSLADGGGQGQPARLSLWWTPTGNYCANSDTGVLTIEEKAKCARYRREKDRTACLASRLLVRRVLSGLCGKAPEELVFGQGSHGKPMLLADDGNPCPVRFNLSHSADLVMLAASTETGVGVDVEKIAERADIAMIARRFFSPDEALELSALSGGERLERFLALWTLKEAAMKALGGDIFLGLAGIRFSFLSGGLMGFSLAGGFPKEAKNLNFALFEPCEGYVAAVAAFGEFSLEVFRAGSEGRAEKSPPVLIARTPGFHPEP
ncbi:MAG: 4'-phosphopantetheinyl transferase superfamily protein [Deltaproteobacteria bacterium]|nr:4'-phosphopantetheinyl transferase superfamily protein [Deltaproteobacteria bacterium]